MRDAASAFLRRSDATGFLFSRWRRPEGISVRDLAPPAWLIQFCDCKLPSRQLRVAQAAGASSAIRLIGKSPSPSRTKLRYSRTGILAHRLGDHLPRLRINRCSGPRTSDSNLVSYRGTIFDWCAPIVIMAHVGSVIRVRCPQPTAAIESQSVPLAPFENPSSNATDMEKSSKRALKCHPSCPFGNWAVN